MTRRELLRAALAAPALLLTGCPVSFEQGLFAECRSPAPAGASQELVRAAWTGLRAADVWDVHAHLVGNGRRGSGIFLDPALDHPRTPVSWVRHRFFRNAACIGSDDEQMDEAMVARLVALARTLPAGAKLMLLAFDYAVDESGVELAQRTTVAIPDEYARRVAAAHRERFEWIASIHPYRADAVSRLERAKAQGARAVKWLPPAMGMDLAHPKCVPFYDALRRVDMPLLIHVGEEQAVPGVGRNDLGNPLKLRHPLDHGVRVIAAHCATLGHSADLDRDRNPDKAPQAANFELFARLMDEKRYAKLLFGDISAVTQLNRVDHLPALLTRAEWHERLLNGSDYPLPGMLPIFSLKALVSKGMLDDALVPALRELRQANALLFDFALKRNLRLGRARFPERVFETRPFFEKA
jgi:mannonate dehydratase